MTNSTKQNPPADTNERSPKQVLRVVRIVIALGLFVGIAVFSVLTIEELKAGPPTRELPTDFGTSTAMNEQAANAGSPLAGLRGINPNNYPPILRPNPHPGEFAPFLNAAPFAIPPYFQDLGGEIWEHCDYEVNNASLTDLLNHYDKQATARGMKRIKQHPTSNERPGGIAAAWSDGQTSLRVTAWPLPSKQNVQPPLAPATPLHWVVKYSYPAPRN